MNGDPVFDFWYLIGFAIPLLIVAGVLALGIYGIRMLVVGAVILKAVDNEILHQRRNR